MMSSSMGKVGFSPCQHQIKGKGDGCQDFDPSDGDPLTCDCCGCHRNFHVVLYNEGSILGMCRRDIGLPGGPDGCQAFIPSTTPREKYCACCSHHRNFHEPLNLQKNSMLSTKCPSGNNMRPDSSSEPSGHGSSTPSLSDHHPNIHGNSTDLVKEAQNGNANDDMAHISNGVHDLDMSKYDIFVNHRGPDAKLGFIAHLEEEFKRHGLTAWVDKNALVKGERASEAIKRAIKRIRVHLAFFSPGYTESVHCLNELVGMTECQHESRKSVLLPVFYKVKPENLRRPELFEPFRSGLQKHKDRGLCVEKWKTALQEAAELTGISLETVAGDESKLKKAIVEEVERILGRGSVRMQTGTPKHKVGLQAMLKSELEELAKMGDGLAIRGISGMGGIGKTTLAKEVYNHYSQEHSFECQTFLQLGKEADMVALQRQALNDLLEERNVENVGERYNYWFSRLIGRSVLIVIDDIQIDHQFMQLVPDITRLGSRSRIILTSREQHVLRLIMSDIPNFSLHIMETLNPAESFELFTVHAFKGTKPPSKASNSKMHDWATQITRSCDGLPLALEILGKHMFGKTEDVWSKTAETLHSRPEVLSKLSISFEGLPSEAEKMMFLDIACQMIGLHVADAINIWESCAPTCTDLCLTSRNVPDSLAILKDKSLIDVDTNNLLTMHDLLQEMGKELVCKGNLLTGKRLPFGARSHLWDSHAESLLKGGKDVEENIRGMSLVGTKVNMATIDASMFKKFVELHLLQLDGTRIEGDFSGTSGKLRWLQWRSSFLEYMPTKMCFSYLTMLDLSESNTLTRLWSKDQAPKLLRVLLLRDCVLLEKIPRDIMLLKYLRKLDLQGCKNLNELPESLGHVKELEYLNLNECGNLNRLPDEMVNLSRLKIFSMNRCSKITTLPENFGNLKELREFWAEGATGLSALTDSFSGLLNVEKIVLTDCHTLTTLPKSIKGLVKLKEVRMQSTAISTLPDDFGDLENLADLFLQHCNCLQSLPQSFGMLKNLRILSLHKCHRFRTLPQNFQELLNLVDLDLEECPIEDGDLPQNLGGLKRLKILRMRKTNVTTLPECFRDLTALVNLNMQESPNLVDVRALPVSLEELVISHCPKLTETLNMETNKWLIKLDLANCTSLTAIQGLEHLELLEEINVSGCRRLVDMHEKLLHKTKMMRCFLSGSGACQEYNNNFLEGKQSSSQLVSYYDHALRFAQNTMPKKINAKEDANELCMETTVASMKKVKAVVIALVAHDQGWSDYPHLHGMYNGQCEIEARIIRGDEEVYSSRLISLRHADHRDQVYLLTLYESHPLTQRLQLDDKVCVFALSRYQRWEITVMQGNIIFVHDEQDHPGSAFGNLKLKDYQPGTHEYPKLIQGCSIETALKLRANGVGDGSSSSQLTRVQCLLTPDPDSESLRIKHVVVHRLERAIYGIRSCDGCKSSSMLEHGWHCNVCDDFDFCKNCYKGSKDVGELYSPHTSDHPMSAFEVMVHILLITICCDGCNTRMSEHGWHCNICDNFYFCENCYHGSKDVRELHSPHTSDHPMSAFEVPKEVPVVGSCLNWGYLVQLNESASNFTWSETFS